MRPEVRFHIREKSQRPALGIGPGKIALLEAIAETGSITSAAKKLNISYRRAWLLVDETNRCLVEPAVETLTGGQKGGGTALTRSGAELVRRYRVLERQTEAAVSSKLGAILRKSAIRRAHD